MNGKISADEVQRRMPNDYYAPPKGMPELYLIFPYDEGHDELLTALADPRILAGNGYIKLSDENWGSGYLWFDGKHWQLRKWTYYCPSEDHYTSPQELWRDFYFEAMPEVTP